MSHGRHIYAKASDMTKAAMCADPQSDHALTHWRYVLICSAKYQSVIIPDQEIDNQYSKPSLSIRFHVYHLISRCTAHGRLPVTDNKKFHKCKEYYISEKSTKKTLEKS